MATRVGRGIDLLKLFICSTPKSLVRCKNLADISSCRVIANFGLTENAGHEIAKQI